MQHRRMRGEGRRTTPWIGYSDLLLTLMIFFGITAMEAGARVDTRPGLLRVVVTDSIAREAVRACHIIAGGRTGDSTDIRGTSIIRFDSIPRAINIDVRAECLGYAPRQRVVQVSAGDTVDVALELGSTGAFVEESIPGDALFAPGSWALTEGAAEKIRDVALRVKPSLGIRDMIIVQGHTDDVPFTSVPGLDNWALSGLRAAAAARVLTSQVGTFGLAPCRVGIMGFGSSRPLEPPNMATDSTAELLRKRKINRRIEFRRLQGDLITIQRCGG